METKKALNSLHQIRQERARTFRTVLIQTVTCKAEKPTYNQAHLVFVNRQLQHNKNQKSLIGKPNDRKNGKIMKRKIINFDVRIKNIFRLGKNKFT
jgi:hypothetical protein